MAVSADGVSVGAVQGAGPRASGAPAGRTRREVARLLLGSAAVACTPVLAASRPSRSADEQRDTGTAFDETYRGRRIQGFPLPAAGLSVLGLEWRVTVDGRPLHLMRRADGTWLSMIDHYSWYRTPLEATRAAVDELGPSRRLRDLAPGPFGGGHAHREAAHGVRA
ncbi:tyrosinase co-factor [Streptomyces sp. ISL-22]|uniref:Tyrosinase co-factor n=1 Tax=Streptomyces curacoi TaxID=146536 RepID=A0A117NXX9_9ACTN|nr:MULTISPECIES: tyrosinase family oxidase copper chaperone [Streptomyces]KUM69448.1 tyrosinase co-factor [Streptomyces curacoi]MBT2423740.1 tyrosinase co-factor [Streptomyces sp. ISL-24]MBT2437885.1 tyrosinase co-factor [Streptomyces sp. ISL-22]